MPSFILAPELVIGTERLLTITSTALALRPELADQRADIRNAFAHNLQNLQALQANAGAMICGLEGRFRSKLRLIRDIIGLAPGVNEFAAMNEVFREFFPKDPPSRTTVGVAHLARAGLKIEIDMIAVVKDAF